MTLLLLLLINVDKFPDFNILIRSKTKKKISLNYILRKN